MGNARTTSLHEKLPVDLRLQVERDLVEQPPGRETYAKVHEYHELDNYQISVKAVERYGGYLRELNLNQYIRDFGDATLDGIDLKPRVEGAIRSRLYEALRTQNPKFSDLMKAAITEKSLREGVIKQEEWEAKKAKMDAELEKLSAINGGRPELTPEVVAEIRSKVLGV